MSSSSKNSFAERGRPPILGGLGYGKVPPQATDLEMAVLGGIMLEKENQDVAFDIIQSAEVFYLDSHRMIYEAIRVLYDTGAPIDLLTVTAQLRKSGNLEMVGGVVYLTELTSSVMSSAHMEAHARIVVEKFMSRELIRVNSASLGAGYDDTTDIFDLIDSTSNEIAAITSGIIRNEPVPVSKSAGQVMREIEEQSQSKENYTGVTSGFTELDAKTSGWQKTDVIILAARPSVGKSSFAINLALNAAKADKPTALFSLEMGEGQIVRRMLAALSGVEVVQISNPNRMTPYELQRVGEASAELARRNIYIDDTAGLSPFALRAKARKLKKKHGIELIIIDYLQLMENAIKGMNREQQVSDISRKIKMLAKDLDVPIIALSQLNRGIENDKNRAPTLSDLRESGAIEQDADIVMFLSNPTSAMIAQKPVFAGKILLNIAKGRNVGLGSIPLNFNKDIQLWKDVDRTAPSPPAMPQGPTYEEVLANKRLAEIGRQNFQQSQVKSFPAVGEDAPF